MKFKYKKMVVMITMGTMLIGFVIFSTVSPGKKADSKDGKENKQEVEAVTDTAQDILKDKLIISDGTIQKDLNTDVSEVVKNYLLASVNCDMDALEETVNNISMVDEDELKLKYELVESVHNIESYMVPGPEENGFLVYVYRDLKLKDIETMAPALSRVYVAAGDNGEYRVFFGADTGLEEFITKIDQSAEVTALVDKVNIKMEEALTKDADLKKFIEKISTKDDGEK